MGIYISGVKGLPEQVQKNKEDIKDIQDEIEGIDFDAIHNLENQVAENTQDIDDLQQGQGVQDTAINAVASKTSALNQSATTLTVDSNLMVEGNIGFNNDDSGNIELNNETNGGNKIVSKQDSNNYIDFDSSNNVHIMSDGGEYEFSGDQILVNGTPIGGSTLYLHTVKFWDTNCWASFIIINGSSIPITTNALLSGYLYSKGFNDSYNLQWYPASGVNNQTFIVGVYALSNTASTIVYIDSANNLQTKNVSTGYLYDIVVQIA